MIRNFDELSSVGESDARRATLEAVEEALKASDPAKLVLSNVSLRDSVLTAKSLNLDLSRFRGVRVVGAGKAGAAMAEALYGILGSRIVKGCVTVPYGTESNRSTGPIRLQPAGHPIPDSNGVKGVGTMMDIGRNLDRKDLVICLLSGGGSALLPCPRPPVTLEEKGRVTSMLLRAGATIQDLNTVRKHLSLMKGGRLAESLYPATVIGLIISDVVGDPLDSIASGPTTPDHTTYDDAIDVLRRFRVWDQCPTSVKKMLEKGSRGEVPETPKAGAKVFDDVTNLIIGSNRIACEAAAGQLSSQGFNLLKLTTRMEGEAREVGRVIASIIKEIAYEGAPLTRPAALILGGETTVRVTGSGKGGRNQELALSAAISLAGVPGVAICAVGTDGIDGVTDAAGAVVDGGTVARGSELKFHAETYLENNDSNAFLSVTGDLIYTGPTGTNVNDIIVSVVV